MRAIRRDIHFRRDSDFRRGPGFPHPAHPRPGRQITWATFVAGSNTRQHRDRVQSHLRRERLGMLRFPFFEVSTTCLSSRSVTCPVMSIRLFTLFARWAAIFFHLGQTDPSRRIGLRLDSKRQWPQSPDPTFALGLGRGSGTPAWR